MTLTLASSILVSICIAKGLAMSKLGGVITLVHTQIMHGSHDHFEQVYMLN